MSVGRQSWMHRNGGKAAFAAAALAAILYSLAVVAAQAPVKRTVDDVVRISSALGRRIEQEGERAVPPLPDAAAVTAHWHERAPECAELPPWTFNRLPDLKVVREEPVDLRKDLYPVADFSAAVDEDFRVELKWKPDPRTSASIAGYDVFRWPEGAKRPEKPVNESPLADPAFTDDDWDAIKPMTAVYYVVRVTAAEEVKTPAGREVESPPLRVEIPDDRRILYFGQGGGVEMAVVYVRRFHRGEWPWERFTVYLGDWIGAEATVPLVEGGEKIKLDFSTGWMLAEIGEEVKEVEVVESVQRIDEAGKTVTEKRVRRKQVAVGFLGLVDVQGRERKIIQSEEGLPDRAMKTLGPSDPLVEHGIQDLKRRLKDVKEPLLRGMLLTRLRHLQKHARRLAASPAEVEEFLLKEKDGLLFKLRWEWILAKDAESLKPRDKSRREKAVELTWLVKDLEEFLGPGGWERERDEWEKDYASFRSKAEFEGREPARWAMPQRPASVPNTDGKQPPPDEGGGEKDRDGKGAE